MSKIAIVYHSGYGHTQVQAEAVARGAAAVAGSAVALIPVADAEARAAELDAADAIVFGAPTYMGSASAPFKGFMDWSSKAWFGQKWKDKLAAGFTNSGSHSGDKLNTLVQMFIFAMQHGMIWIGLGLDLGVAVAGVVDDDDLTHVRRFSWFRPGARAVYGKLAVGF